MCISTTAYPKTVSNLALVLPRRSKLEPNIVLAWVRGTDRWIWQRNLCIVLFHDDEVVWLSLKTDSARIARPDAAWLWSEPGQIGPPTEAELSVCRIRVLAKFFSPPFPVVPSETISATGWFSSPLPMLEQDSHYPLPCRSTCDFSVWSSSLLYESSYCRTSLSIFQNFDRVTWNPS